MGEVGDDAIAGDGIQPSEPKTLKLDDGALPLPSQPRLPNSSEKRTIRHNGKYSGWPYLLTMATNLLLYAYCCSCGKVRSGIGNRPSPLTHLYIFSCDEFRHLSRDRVTVFKSKRLGVRVRISSLI